MDVKEHSFRTSAGIPFGLEYLVMWRSTRFPLTAGSRKKNTGYSYWNCLTSGSGWLFSTKKEIFLQKLQSKRFVCFTGLVKVWWLTIRVEIELTFFLTRLINDQKLLLPLLRKELFCSSVLRHMTISPVCLANNFWHHIYCCANLWVLYLWIRR